jgi:GH18 family chitinase
MQARATQAAPRGRWRSAGTALAGLVLVGGVGCKMNDPAERGLTQQPLVASPKKVSYYPVWSSTGDDFTVGYPQPPSDVPWTKITHINLAFVGIDSTWHCAWVMDDGSPDPASQANAQALINYRNANSPGVKVLLSIGGWTMSYRFSEAMMNATNRNTFVNSCVTLMNNIGADGLDIDWEYPTALGEVNCPSGHTCSRAADAANFTAMLDGFRANAAFGTTKLLTAALRSNLAGDASNIPYEYANFFTGTPRRFDFVNIMSYDFHGGWESTVNFTSPFDQTTASMDYVRTQVGDANKDRIVMGIPFYGPGWKNVNTPGASGVGNAGTAVSAEGNISFGKAKANLLNKYPTNCQVKTPTSGNTQNRYLYCSGSVTACLGVPCSNQTMSKVWVSYEDSAAVGFKADWVAANNYGGIMWWSQGEDSNTSELVNIIDTKLPTGSGGGGGTQSPYGGTAWTIPGTIEAENYDVGGEGVGFHDTTTGNSGNTYRTGAGDNVDIQPTGSPEPAGYNIGWAAAGEWMEYSVNVASGGTYNMNLRVATTGTGKTVHVEMDGVVIGGTIAVPTTATYQTYSTVTTTVSLTAGAHVVRLYHDTGSVNVNWISFVSGCAAETNAAFCARLGHSCGTVTDTDNCGQSRTVSSCGTCMAPLTCGGGGSANDCGCTAETDASFCSRLGKNCGSVTATDNCGGTRTVSSCGSCTSPQSCGGGGTSNVCGCTGESDAAICAGLGATCGSVTATDSCGANRTVSSCGSCTSPLTCGGGMANTCGCAPESDAAFCTRLGASCGGVTANDNCGASRMVTSCGSCTSPQTCGGGGTANVCGSASPWSSQDIGAVAATGSWSQAGSTYTVAGSGADIYGTADEFRFVYQNITGDASITARVATIQNVYTWTKAAVMVRDGLGAGAANATMVASPTASNGYRWQVRATAGGPTTSTTGSNGAAPVWLRIERIGNTLWGFTSADGVTFTLVGSKTVAMAATVQIGLAVTSHTDGALANATFDNVTIASGPAWSSQDVGAVASAGSWSQSAGTYTVVGSGADIWGTADEFRFVYLPVAGDATIIARMNSVQNTHAFAKAGLMMRKDLTAGSMHVFVDASPGTTVMKLEKRATAGATSSATDDAASAPNRWLRLVRVGTTFSASWSNDGVSWTSPTGWTNQAMTGLSGTLYVGLAVTSHNDGMLCTSSMDSVSITTP